MRRTRRDGSANCGSKPVTAAEFRADDVAVPAQRFAQRADLNLEVLLRHHDTRPHPAHEFVFCYERAVGLQKREQEIKRARAELDRNTVGQELPPAQQHAETAEFNRRFGVS
jgi:hypothetical protein